MKPVLVTGGVNGTGTGAAVTQPQLWDPDPANEHFSLMADQLRRDGTRNLRGYHSVAVLLPDARILSGTGDNGCPGASNIQFFSPAYLFDANGLAPRPTITWAPATVKYSITGQTQQFFVETSATGANVQVSWIRLPSATHAYDQNQHFYRFPSADVAQVAGGLTIAAPFDPNLVPPGHYMMFVLQNGVPSVAKIVKIVPADVVPSCSARITTNPERIVPAARVGIQAVHIIELRQAVDCLRAEYGLSSYSWQILGNSITAQPLIELRSVLSELYILAGLASQQPRYADPTLGQGVPIRAAHIQDLRDAVWALW